MRTTLVLLLALLLGGCECRTPAQIEKDRARARTGPCREMVKVLSAEYGGREFECPNRDHQLTVTETVIRKAEEDDVGVAIATCRCTGVEGEVRP